MNATKKLICVLSAAAALAATAPAFADSGHDRDHQRGQRYYADHERRDERGYQRARYGRTLAVFHRPLVLERPVYSVQPAPYYVGLAAIIGAAIGSYIDSRQ